MNVGLAKYYISFILILFNIYLIFILVYELVDA